MKKWMALFLALTLAVSMAACGKGRKETVENLEGTMEAVIEKINEKHPAVELPLMTMALDLTDADALAYNTGLSSADKITEAAVSEPMMGQAYSLVLVRVEDAAEAEAVAKEMLDNVDTRKWVCNHADTKVAAAYGDVAMFFMVSSEFAQQATTNTVLEAFKAVCPGEVKVIG